CRADREDLRAILKALKVTNRTEAVLRSLHYNGSCRRWQVHRPRNWSGYGPKREVVNRQLRGDVRAFTRVRGAGNIRRDIPQRQGCGRRCVSLLLNPSYTDAG